MSWETSIKLYSNCEFNTGQFDILTKTVYKTLTIQWREWLNLTWLELEISSSGSSFQVFKLLVGHSTTYIARGKHNENVAYGTYCACVQQFSIGKFQKAKYQTLQIKRPHKDFVPSLPKYN